jgi:hypothetical protein
MMGITNEAGTAYPSKADYCSDKGEQHLNAKACKKNQGTNRVIY